MHDSLKEQIELMGYTTDQVAIDPQTEQDHLMTAMLLRMTRTSDFTDEELAYYNAAMGEMPASVKGKVLTSDFTDEELAYYQSLAETYEPGGCKGFRLTPDPTEEEMKEWTETLDYLNKLDFAEVRKRVRFIDKDESKPYEDADPEWDFDSSKIVATCPLGQDPWNLHDDLNRYF